MDSTTTDVAAIALVMRLLPNLRVNRKILTDSERTTARKQIHFLSSLYRSLLCGR